MRRGFDISHHQHSYNYSVGQHDFGIIRASYGITEDRKFQEHKESIAEVPARGVYHYLSSLTDWRWQSDFFLELTNNEFDAYFLDFEKAFNDPSYQFGSDAHKFIDSIIAETGKETALYTNRYVYQTWLSDYGHTWMKDYPFWIAQYPYNRVWDDSLYDIENREGYPELPDGAPSYVIGQYSADGNGKAKENGVNLEQSGEYALDLNMFNPAVDFDAFFGVDSEPVSWWRRLLRELCKAYG